MPKLAIYIPKEEMRRLEKWRKRINFSRIFMQALEQEIREQTRMADVADGKLVAAAKYYQRKLSESCQPLVDAGFELGTARVLRCRLTPEQIRQLLEISEQDEYSDESVVELEKVIGDDHKRLAKTFQKLGFDEQSFPTWRRMAYRGFVQGVAAAWRQVCERMG